VEDASGGLEAVPIPVFNEVDSEPAPAFEYIAAYVLDSDKVVQAVRDGEAAAGRVGRCVGV
jgi:hypothetical protein